MRSRKTEDMQSKAALRIVSALLENDFGPLPPGAEAIGQGPLYRQCGWCRRWSANPQGPFQVGEPPSRNISHTMCPDCQGNWKKGLANHPSAGGAAPPRVGENLEVRCQSCNKRKNEATGVYEPAPPPADPKAVSSGVCPECRPKIMAKAKSALSSMRI